MRGTGDAVVVVGSPVPGSRTRLVADWIHRQLEARGLGVETVDLRALPPDDLIGDAAPGRGARQALDRIAHAAGLVVVTPVHHAACSGLLKVFLDFLPQGALAGHVVVPVAVGGSLAHVLTIDYSLRPILMCLGASHVTAGHFLQSADVSAGSPGAVLAPGTEARLREVIAVFVESLRGRTCAAVPGPPGGRCNTGAPIGLPSA